MFLLVFKHMWIALPIYVTVYCECICQFSSIRKCRCPVKCCMSHVIRLLVSSVPCWFVTSIIKRFLIDIAEEAAISEIFNIFLGLSFFFIYYEVTGYFFYHINNEPHPEFSSFEMELSLTRTIWIRVDEKVVLWVSQQLVSTQLPATAQPVRTTENTGGRPRYGLSEQPNLDRGATWWSGNILIRLYS